MTENKIEMNASETMQDSSVALIRVDRMQIPVRPGRSLPVFVCPDHMALPSCLRCDPKWDIRQSFQGFICRFHQL